MSAVAVRYKLRAELRRRWVSTLVLTLIVALVGGVILASTAGARRTRTAYDRLLASSKPAHGMVFAELETLEALRALPEVGDVGAMTLFAAMPRDHNSNDHFLPMMSSIDGRIPYEINRVIVEDGRLPDPAEPHELALREKTARLLGVSVGDELAMLSFTPDEARALEESQGEAPEPTGPEFSFDVVGITKDASDVIARESDLTMHWLTPAFADRYEGKMGTWGTGAFVVRADGVTQEALAAALTRLDPALVLEDLDFGVGSFNASLALIANGLLLFAAVLAVAGVVVAAQAFVRGASGRRGEDSALAALGMGVRSRMLLGAGPGLAAAVAGGVGAVLLAVASSARFPIGIARRAEPEPGIDIDGIVVFGGAAAVTVVVAGLAVGAAWLATRPGSERTVRSATLSSGLRALLPPAAATGVTMASSRTAANLPIRSSRSAVAAGALGVTAALVFAASLSDLLATPRLYGWTFDAGVDGTENDPDRLADGVVLEDDPAVAETAPVLFQIQLTIEGRPTFGAAIGYGDAGRIGPVVAEGRPPATPDEIAVGGATLAKIGGSIGDEVQLDAGNGPTSFRIVGRAVLPVSGDGNTRVDSGVSMTIAAAERLGVDTASRCEFDQTCYGQTAVRWVPGADVDAAVARLLEDGELSDFGLPRPPAEVERLKEVEAVPWVLAVVLGMLGAVAIVHTVWLTLRRRRHDLGILRTLGFCRAQLRTTVAAQSASIVVIAALVGALIGVAVGRALWDLVATDVGVASEPAVPLTAVMSIPAVAITLSQVLVLAPARRVGSARPAQVLRVE